MTTKSTNSSSRLLLLNKDHQHQHQHQLLNHQNQNNSNNNNNNNNNINDFSNNHNQETSSATTAEAANNILFNKNYELSCFNYMQMTSYFLCCCFMRLKSRFKFKSIEHIWLCLFIFLFNVYLVHENYFQVIFSFSSSAQQQHQEEQQQRLQKLSWSNESTRVILMLVFLLNCFVLWPLFVFFTLFKVGSFANDSFRLGKDLDLDMELENDFELFQYFRDHYRGGGSVNQLSFEQLFSSIPWFRRKFQLKTSSGIKRKILLRQRIRSIWRYYLPPLSCVVHLMMAISILYSSLLIKGDQISNGLNPKSYVFHSELDILFARPLERVKLFEPPALNNNNNSSNINRLYDNHRSKLNIIQAILPTTKSQPSLPIMSFNYQPKIQFQQQKITATTTTATTTMKTKMTYTRLLTVDRSEKNLTKNQEETRDLLVDKREINYEPRLSYELINFLLALILFQLNYSKTLWHLNKLYSLAFSIHLFFIVVIVLFNWSTFEVMYKYQLFEKFTVNQSASVAAATGENFVVKFEILHHQPRKYAALSTNGTEATVPAFLKEDDHLRKKSTSPFLTDSAFTIHLLHIFTLVIVFLTSTPIYMFAIYKYKSLFKANKRNFLRFILFNQINGSSCGSSHNNVDDSPSNQKSKQQHLLPTINNEQHEYEDDKERTSSASKEDTNLLIQNLANELYKLNAVNRDELLIINDEATSKDEDCSCSNAKQSHPPPLPSTMPPPSSSEKIYSEINHNQTQTQNMNNKSAAAATVDEISGCKGGSSPFQNFTTKFHSSPTSASPTQTSTSSNSSRSPQPDSSIVSRLSTSSADLLAANNNNNNNNNNNSNNSNNNGQIGDKLVNKHEDNEYSSAAAIASWPISNEANSSSCKTTADDNLNEIYSNEVNNYQLNEYNQSLIDRGANHISHNTNDDSNNNFVNCSLDLFMNESYYKPYKSHLIALLVLLIMCLSTTILQVYDSICLYQLTSDRLPITNSFLYISFILWYILFWLLLTITTSTSMNNGGNNSAITKPKGLLDQSAASDALNNKCYQFYFSESFRLDFWYSLNKYIKLNYFNRFVDKNHPHHSFQVRPNRLVHGLSVLNGFDSANNEPNRFPAAAAYKNNNSNNIEKNIYEDAHLADQQQQQQQKKDATTTTTDFNRFSSIYDNSGSGDGHSQLQNMRESNRLMRQNLNRLSASLSMNSILNADKTSRQQFNLNMKSYNNRQLDAVNTNSKTAAKAMTIIELRPMTMSSYATTQARSMTNMSKPTTATTTSTTNNHNHQLYSTIANDYNCNQFNTNKHSNINNNSELFVHDGNEYNHNHNQQQQHHVVSCIGHQRLAPLFENLDENKSMNLKAKLVGLNQTSRFGASLTNIISREQQQQQNNNNSLSKFCVNRYELKLKPAAPESATNKQQQQQQTFNNSSSNDSSEMSIASSSLLSAESGLLVAGGGSGGGGHVASSSASSTSSTASIKPHHHLDIKSQLCKSKLTILGKTKDLVELEKKISDLKQQKSLLQTPDFYSSSKSYIDSGIVNMDSDSSSSNQADQLPPASSSLCGNSFVFKLNNNNNNNYATTNHHRTTLNMNKQQQQQQDESTSSPSSSVSSCSANNNGLLTTSSGCRREAGTFKSKCISASGTSITMSQTMQNLQQQLNGSGDNHLASRNKPILNNNSNSNSNNNFNVSPPYSASSIKRCNPFDPTTTTPQQQQQQHQQQQMKKSMSSSFIINNNNNNNNSNSITTTQQIILSGGGGGVEAKAPPKIQFVPSSSSSQSTLATTKNFNHQMDNF